MNARKPLLSESDNSRWSRSGFRCGCYNQSPVLIRRWQTWAWVGWLVGRLYVLGIISGSHYGWHGNAGVPGHVCGISFNGRRPYKFFISRDQWACLRRGHWPKMLNHGGDFGMCGICYPCPGCGSQTDEHPDSCPDFGVAA